MDKKLLVVGLVVIAITVVALAFISTQPELLSQPETEPKLLDVTLEKAVISYGEDYYFIHVNDFPVENISLKAAHCWDINGSEVYVSGYACKIVSELEAEGYGISENTMRMKIGANIKRGNSYKMEIEFRALSYKNTKLSFWFYYPTWDELQQLHEQYGSIITLETWDIRVEPY